MELHGYYRSSASWRVRIALNLKGLPATHLTHHLRKGEQRDPNYLQLNPQGLVPTLSLDSGPPLTQSLAIIEWLDETHPQPPLLPSDPLRRARVRAFAQVIACDTHPVQNLKVLARLRQLGLPEDTVTACALARDGWQEPLPGSPSALPLGCRAWPAASASPSSRHYFRFPKLRCCRC